MSEFRSTPRLRILRWDRLRRYAKEAFLEKISLSFLALVTAILLLKIRDDASGNVFISSVTTQDLMLSLSAFVGFFFLGFVVQFATAIFAPREIMDYDNMEKYLEAALKPYPADQLSNFRHDFVENWHRSRNSMPTLRYFVGVTQIAAFSLYLLALGFLLKALLPAVVSIALSGQ